MTKRVLGTVVIATALFLSFLAGRYSAMGPSGFDEAGRGFGASAVEAPAKEVKTQPRPEIVRRASTGASATKARPSTIESLRSLLDLQRRGILSNPIGITRYEGRVDPRFAELYGLTPAETSNLQQILDAMHAKMATVTAERSRLVEIDSNHVVIAVDPFPEAGGALYDRANASIAELLGPERAEIFAQLSSAALENEFAGFGASQRTVTVTHAGTADNPYSVVQDSWTQTSDQLTTTARTTFNLRTSNDLARLGLGPALPLEFQQLPPKPNAIAGGSQSSVLRKG